MPLLWLSRNACTHAGDDVLWTGAWRWAPSSWMTCTVLHKSDYSRPVPDHARAGTVSGINQTQRCARNVMYSMLLQACLRAVGFYDSLLVFVCGFTLTAFSSSEFHTSHGHGIPIHCSQLGQGFSTNVTLPLPCQTDALIAFVHVHEHRNWCNGAAAYQ